MGKSVFHRGDDEDLPLFFDREVDEAVLAVRCSYPLAPQSAVSLEGFTRIGSVLKAFC